MKYGAVLAAAWVLFSPLAARATEPESSEIESELVGPSDLTPEAAGPTEGRSSNEPAPATATRKVPAETSRSARSSVAIESNPVFNTIPASNWRHTASAAGSDNLFEASRFLLEVRFGPYAPRVDMEFNGKATPYADFFGTSPKVYFGLELDWLPVRLPYVGTVGAAFGWGRVTSSGKAKTAGADAGSDTALTINPMYVDAVVRFDALTRSTSMPLVPYIKGGVGIGMWQGTGPSGTSAVGGVTGQGTSLGPHLAIGGALALNAFDRRTAMAMRHETGIQQAYVWGEWMLAALGAGAENVMQVGASTGVAGLAIEY